MDDPMWVIRGSQIMDMLRRVEEGEPRVLVYLEEYANAETHEYVEGDGDGT